jgi:hypothetical protein
LIVVLPFLLGACIQERPQGVIIGNDLVDPVEIVYLKNGEMNGGRLDPAATKVFPFDLYRPGVTDKESCTTADIVARSLDGEVVARVPPPRCIDSNIRLSDWVVP